MEIVKIIKADATLVKSVVEVDVNLVLLKLLQKLGGWSKSEGIYFILLRIAPIVILSDREKTLKV